MRWEDSKIFNAYLTEGNKKGKAPNIRKNPQGLMGSKTRIQGNRKAKDNKKNARRKVVPHDLNERLEPARIVGGMDQFKPQHKKTLNPNQTSSNFTGLFGTPAPITTKRFHEGGDDSEVEGEQELPLIGSKVRILPDAGYGDNATGNIVNHAGDQAIVELDDGEIPVRISAFDLKEIPTVEY